MLPYRAAVAAALLAMGVSADQQYCSSQNTGSSNSQGTNIYMSNGLCSDDCRSQYAFAIVSYQSCYCSDYVPSDQESTSSCNQDCPGYPAEQCGNANSGLYGYIALDKAPSGTAGAATASSTQQPTSSTTSTQAPTTSTRATSTSAPSTTKSSATPVTNVIMTTISGAVVTQTVTSTPVVASGSNDQVPLQRNDGLGAGAIAGIVIGVLLGVALVAIIAFLLWRRRRNDDNERQGGSVAGSKKSMTRNVSVLSKAGLLSRNNTRPTSMGERDHDDAHNAGQNSVRHSMLFAGNDGISPVSPLDSSHSGDSRRHSKPMVYDQRLNPSALFANQEANGSRVSMQDTQDYSRPLGVMNPDIRASFESRTSRA
ncbi:hypothetical protein DOTSEDRAFT_43682 [Dothistroma septosporum NZE10]|uniref:WSC domain-containing protein n=1 Tax=Dothistroma septosporum (strain NZE10 / CBS 128990) TaxID=675120 RepID=N1PSG6_DOTSN|nr:hypothetical protein DOTSEDRAFT_43682 [Dothistroma septosporum NZE10]